jgi:signal transduction histidine kinase
MDLVKETVYLPQLIKNSVDSYIFLTKNKKISVSSHADPALPAIKADPRRLDQVLSNLLSNAIKFTPESGEIEIRAEQENHAAIKLTVKDNGVGILPEEIPTLFQKYGQTSSGKTSAQKGTGLGLLIVKTIVESHGGTVNVESVAGQGASFIVRLPVCA